MSNERLVFAMVFFLYFFSVQNTNKCFSLLAILILWFELVLLFWVFVTWWSSVRLWMWLLLVFFFFKFLFYLSLSPLVLVCACMDSDNYVRPCTNCFFSSLWYNIKPILIFNVMTRGTLCYVYFFGCVVFVCVCVCCYCCFL